MGRRLFQKVVKPIKKTRKKDEPAAMLARVRAGGAFQRLCRPQGRISRAVLFSGVSARSNSGGLSLGKSAMVRRSTRILASMLPRFPVRASDVRVLRSPGQFYDELVRGIRGARQRIVLSTLYIGTDSMSEALLDELSASLQKNEELTVSILVDKNRSLRREAGAHGGAFHNLARLVEKFGPDRVEARLLPSPRPPAPLRWALRGKARELYSVQHTKVYMFDDCTMLSGANLSQIYFTKRQDRYVSFQSHGLASFYGEMVATLGEFAEPVGKRETSTPMSTSTSTSGSIVGMKSHPDGHLSRAASRKLAGRLRQHFSPGARGGEEDTAADTWVYPTFQMGLYGLRLDAEACTALATSASWRQSPDGCGNDTAVPSRVAVAAGYLNLTEDLTRALESWGSTAAESDDGPTRTVVLGASAKANGWHGASGPAGLIPTLYDCYSAEAAARGLEVREWARDGWTFHAKGLWLFARDGAARESKELPFLVAVGSSNFGHRSAVRDVESQAIVVTENLELREKFANEYEGLVKHAPMRPVAKPPKAGHALRAAARILRSFL